MPDRVPKILITGADGQLGRDCAQLFAQKYAVEKSDKAVLDITDGGQVDAFVATLRPDVVVNCAAFTQVDACETERESAWSINVEGPHNLAISLARYGGSLVHISTDYVFDGQLAPGQRYDEATHVNPASFYGQTKAEGEKRIRQSLFTHTIVRTAWLYGRHGHNFLKTMLKLALDDPQRIIKVVNDQFGSPTWSRTLAKQLLKLVGSGGRGTYHASAEGFCTWYELAALFLKQMGVPHRLTPCSSEDYSLPAPRPRNAVMENKRLKSEGLNLMQPWQEDLRHFVLKHGRELMDDL